MKHFFLACLLLVFTRASSQHLDSTQQIKEVEISVKKATRMEMTPLNTEIINSSDLVKDACCNLSESFENSASVDVNFADAVSGAKEIKMLGLDGIYAQMLGENIPSVRGLNQAFGSAYIPGPWMQSIQVTKGTGSVVNGFESITGQINTEFKKPQNAEKLFVNLFLNQDVRTELNLYANQILKKKKQWSFGEYIHTQLNWLKMDLNKDGFIDNPLVKQLNYMQRATYMNNKNFMFITAANLTLEERKGGQMLFDFHKDLIDQTYWGMSLKTKRFDWFAKTGFTFKNNHSLGIQYKYYYHAQDGFIGYRKYAGLEHFGYLNAIYQHTFGEFENMIKFGASLQTNYTNEHFDISQYNRMEIIPGFFSEGTFNYKKKLNVVAGLRVDAHNLYGTFLSPRLHLKWNILYNLSFRISGGKGYRVPVAFAENINFLANNRTLIWDQKIKPEIAWNYGSSLQWKFFLNYKEGSIVVDFYRTQFRNQLIIDLENANELRMYNLEGVSYSNSLQVEFSYPFFKNFDCKIAYKFDDVKTTYQGVKKQLLLKPRNKGLISLEYKTNNKQWRFNSHLTWYSSSRVPQKEGASTSKNLFLWNAQVTYILKQRFDFYIGAENMLNQTQKNPIISAANPESSNFDSSLIWGPVRGAMVFCGFRFSLK